jgi:hypothetical protein
MAGGIAKIQQAPFRQQDQTDSISDHVDLFLMLVHLWSLLSAATRNFIVEVAGCCRQSPYPSSRAYARSDDILLPVVVGEDVGAVQNIFKNNQTRPSPPAVRKWGAETSVTFTRSRHRKVT